MQYNGYIHSPQWRNQHALWLQKSGHRCALFFWVRCGKVDGKYHRYEVHHLNRKAYQRQGREVYGRDVIVLCPFAHKVIIHRLLGGADRVRNQRNFPNSAQQLAYIWCCLPWQVKPLLCGGVGLWLLWELFL